MPREAGEHRFDRLLESDLKRVIEHGQSKSVVLLP
jgi:hypothetical protein